MAHLWPPFWQCCLFSLLLINSTFGHVEKTVLCEHPDSQFSEFDATTLADCTLPKKTGGVLRAAQAIQYAPTSKHRVLQCLVTVFRTAQFCSWDKNGGASTVDAWEEIETSPTLCREMHKYLHYKPDAHKASKIDLELGKEKSGTIHVQGKIGTEGQCSSPGSAYGDFNYHVVEERVRVFINEIEIVSVNGTYKLADSIFTPNREGHVFGFGTYVIDTPEPDCLGTFAEVFYTDEIFLPENPKYNDLAVYRNPTKKEYATLTLGPKVQLCPYTPKVYSTNLDGLFLYVMNNRTERKFEIEPLSANPLNVRPANSVTMSLNYAQFSTHMDIEDVYRAFTKRDCERNSDYLRLAIAVSTKCPSCSSLFVGEGSMLNHRGAIITLGICADVSHDVTIRKLDGNVCYEDLAVWYKKIYPMWRHPISFALKNSSSPVDCKKDFSIHKINSTFWTQNPNFTRYHHVPPLVPEMMSLTAAMENVTFEHLGIVNGGSMNKVAISLLADSRRMDRAREWDDVLDQGLDDSGGGGPSNQNPFLWLKNEMMKGLAEINSHISENFFYGMSALGLICVAIVILIWWGGCSRMLCKDHKNPKAINALCAPCCAMKHCCTWWCKMTGCKDEDMTPAVPMIINNVGLPTMTTHRQEEAARHDDGFSGGACVGYRRNADSLYYEREDLYTVPVHKTKFNFKKKFSLKTKNI